MIDTIHIQNYKSIVDLSLDLGRVNVIIGANGSGKSNILEAISLASAANQNRLDNEYLGARIRLTEPDFMHSEFAEMEEEDLDKVITINCKGGSALDCTAYLFYDKKEAWVNLGMEVEIKRINNAIKTLVKKNNEEIIDILKNEIEESDNKEDTNVLFNEIISDPDFDLQSKIPNFTSQLQNDWFKNPKLSSFLIYAPEESNLRKFSDDTMIRPLGRRGEGLFKHIKELISNEENGKELMEALNEGLSLLDWFKEFEIPSDLFTQEQRLNISDRFLKESKQVFDEKSTNEGFLFLLFYLVLFNSPKTPSFFAIDNIETSFNPKLSQKLISYLITVAKKNNKQVILTTHSPYVLDGLDLSDDEQRLFVVRRNSDGHTKVSRVPYRENRTLQLSEVWMSGTLGGLPDNF